MSKPPKPPKRPASPATSSLSEISLDSCLHSEVENFFPGGTSSLEVKKLFDAFESAVPFSQLMQRGGRGEQVVLQNIGILNHIWANRDPANPALCFDKHDGRPGTRIFNPPRRGPGGVVIPCLLDGTNVSASGAVQSINIVNNNVSLQSMQYQPRMIANDTGAPSKQLNQMNLSKRNKIQTTFKASNKPQSKMKKTMKDSRGRFTKKKIVSTEDLRGTAPCIPLNTRGLRRLLRQWVKGDPERGLLKPLAEFSTDERNGKDGSGKPNKTLYSKRRTVVLAIMLALQDALDNRKTFSEAIGVPLSSEEVEQLPLSGWEKVAKCFLKKEGRKMTQKEVIDLGTKIYRHEVLDMLPEDDD